MAKAICPHCGTEFDSVDPKKVNNMNVHNLDGVGVLLPSSEAKWTPDNVENKKEREEEKKMESTMNGINMEVLAKMVAKEIAGNTAAQSNDKPVDGNASSTNISNKVEISKVDGGIWAKNSKYYGQEICGAMYNPYLVRRFLPRQFVDMMKRSLVIEPQIRQKYDLLDSVKYIIKECEKLELLRKKDLIAFKERSLFWTEPMVRAIFTDYIEQVLDDIELNICKIKKGEVFIYKGMRGKIKRTPILNKMNNSYISSISCEIEWDYEKELMTAKDKLIYARTYDEMADIMKVLRKVKINGRLSNDFIEGYKKSGAYYTLKNMIMFDNGVYQYQTGREAIDKLKLDLHLNTPAYIFYARLKEAMKVS